MRPTAFLYALLFCLGLSVLPGVPSVAEAQPVSRPAEAAAAVPPGPRRADNIEAELVPLSRWAAPGSTVVVAVIFRAIQTFGLFDLVFVLTGGGPGGRTQTIAVYAYDVVFRYQELAYGCALVVAMALCLVLMTSLMLAASRRGGAR